MTLGPGKYDDLCSYVRKQVGITDDGGGGVMLIVLGGNRGNGFACQADIRTTLSLPDLLENIARATGCARSAQAVTACRRDGGSIERWRCRSPERPAGSLALRRTYPRPRRRCGGPLVRSCPISNRCSFARLAAPVAPMSGPTLIGTRHQRRAPGL
jgi:hypothetical protein